MSRYRIVQEEQKYHRYLIQKKDLFRWRFIDFRGFYTPKDTRCVYETYESAEENLKDIMENFGKYAIIKEFEIKDKVETFKRIKRV